jgi:hypothetical protein
VRGTLTTERIKVMWNIEYIIAPTTSEYGYDGGEDGILIGTSKTVPTK